MVYVRWPQLKSGFTVNARTHIDPAALTPTQKMMLTRNRIWGHMVGGGFRSGYKILKQNWTASPASKYYEYARLKQIYPFIDEWEKQNKMKVKYEEKKARIFMRGVKIGTKRTSSQKGMGVFEMAKKKDKEMDDAAEAQRIKEEKAKSKMTDESLGLK